MLYDFRNFFKLQFYSLFRSEGKHFRLTPKRLGVLAIFYLLFPIIEFTTWVSLFLDELFFPDYHKQQIMKPVFVIGNYRSGTTFLHRLLAMDERKFTAMSGWEVFIAPSILQRKIIHRLAAIDRAFGAHIYQAFDRWWQKNIQDHIDFHTLGVTDPEEDEIVLGHIGAGVIPWNMFPVMEEGVPKYAKFDSALTESEKNRVMNFYLRVVQRHLYTKKKGLFYLSKSPSFSGQVDSIYKTFPDAKIIYLVRNPMEMVPSQIHMWAFKWHVTCSPLEPYPYKEELMEMIKYWYDHPLERLSEAPDESYQVVIFDDLVANPEKVIGEIYEKFGFEMSPRLERRLRRIVRKRKKNENRQKYSLRQMGITVSRIRKEFAAIFRRFHFKKSTWQLLRLDQKKEKAQIRPLRLRRKPSQGRFWQRRLWRRKVLDYSAWPKR